MADDLESWLAGLDLANYAGAFAENEVTLSDLPHLTDDDLKEIGLPIGPRRRRLAHLAGVQPKAPSVKQAGPPSSIHAADPNGAERWQLTVLFSDLVGPTGAVGRPRSEDMRQLIRAYQDAVAGITARDGVLANFGYPKAHEDQAALAVRAGLAIVDAVARQATPDARPLAARVGIATGLVVVGDLIGTDAAREETVVGEAPNLAVRPQSLAGPGEVVTSATTRRLLGTEFVLVAERAVETRFEARGQALHPPVGRDQELALLLERWNQTKAGEARPREGRLGEAQ